jgi:hypothetical protein
MDLNSEKKVVIEEIKVANNVQDDDSDSKSMKSTNWNVKNVGRLWDVRFPTLEEPLRKELAEKLLTAG